MENGHALSQLQPRRNSLWCGNVGTVYPYQPSMQ